MSSQPDPANVVIALLSIGLLLLLGLSLLIGWVSERRRVKRSQKEAPSVMSRAREERPQDQPSSLRQTAPQTDRQPQAPAFSRDVMLDMYKLLRAHDVPREKARPVLKAAGFPLDNNLWTEAAPPEEETPYTTPIAGRATAAQFETEPDLRYQPPPR